MVILLHVVPLILLKQDEVFNLNSRDTSMFNLGDCSDQQLLDILLKRYQYIPQSNQESAKEIYFTSCRSEGKHSIHIHIHATPHF